MVGLVIRLTEHANDCIITGPVIYEFPSREVAEHTMLMYFRDKVVATLDEYEEWRDNLAPEELFHIINIHSYRR
jgi:hypothetical protein